MSTPPVPAAPQIDINTPAAQIAQVNQESQGTPTPGQPRNPDGTFAPPAAPPVAAPAGPTPENPVIVTDLGEGKFKAQYLTGETFEGSAADVLAKTGQAHVNTKLWAKQQVQQTQQPPQVQAPPAPQSRFKTPEEKATADYVAQLLGFPDVEALENKFNYVEANTTDYAAQTVALQFQAVQQDFNPTTENSDKLMKVINDSGIGPAFDAAPRDQQVQMLRQAHAYCLMAKIYDPKPVTAAPNIPAPPPPAPGGRAQVPMGQLPDNLKASLNDNPDQIKAKWAEAQRLGYV